jgi:glycosyltransferase involved in cell wall biosynthesis
MIRVAFVLPVTTEVWLGGVNYFRNLLGAIELLPQQRIAPVIFSSSSVPVASLLGVSQFELHKLSLLDRGSPGWVARRLMRRLSSRDFLLERELRLRRIDVISHSGHLGPHAAVPVIGWIPDFQHRRMPAFFRARERRIRDSEYMELCRNAACVIVSSRTALADLSEFCPDAMPKARVLRFVAHVPDTSTLPSRQELQEKYGFSGSYFLLPNQFWGHKNHEAVVDALALLRKQGIDARVLATGNTRDQRQPERFNWLIERVRSRGVGEQFRPLGIVPMNDLMGLMWHCLAVINPSRFEGWSTSVEEAKSMGKPVLLSDISTHREQCPPGGSFFDPDDAQALASLMGSAWASAGRVAEDALAADARAQLAGRRLAFAQQFEDLVLETVGSTAGPGERLARDGRSPGVNRDPGRHS